MQTGLARLARFLPTLMLASTLAAQQRPTINGSTDPLLAPFRFRGIGPASMSGRIDDIAISETDPNIIYVGFAVNGVWKSENNGTTFEPIFDTYSTTSIGDIAIHPRNPNIVYVGTGEANNRQTSTFGDGMYKTTDGGKTFQHIGLRETQTIARIVIDPRNPEVLYVASPGHLFGPSPDRGIYKSSDGGKTWSKVKFIDENTGFTDLAMDPSNSSILYAASYQRRRTTCCFNGGGPGSALWKTDDAGKTWTKISGNGLPSGTYGRIALDVAKSNPNVVYVQVEAGETGTPIVAGRGRGGGGGAGGGGFNWCNNGGPDRGFGGRGGGEGEENPAGGRAGAPAGPRTPPALNAAEGGVFRSDDKGRSWKLVTNCNARPMYFSQLRVDPQNENTLYVAGLPVAKSLDGGKTFATLDDAGGHGDPGHVDQHAIWVDPKNSKHLMIGNDGGLDISWDQGKTWDYINTIPGALAYVVTADMGHPYYVYIGLQDNGSWGGPSMKRGNAPIVGSDWFRIGGGDGFYTAADPTDFHIIYSESQNGNTNRIDLKTGRQVSIRPRAPGGAGRGGAAGGGGGAGGGGAQQGPPNVINAQQGDAYRFNWNTPYILSPHNPSVVWYGGNRLFKSYDRGDSWVASADLTKNIDRNTIAVMDVPGDRTMLSKNDGLTQWGTIITVSESPVMPGVVWAGTDDGLLQLTRDGGATFTEVGKNLPGLPANHLHWVSRVDASHFDAGTAYVSVDGHRSDDLKPYVFVTRDYGKTFQSITNGLPAYGNVQVVKEDPKNKDLLYVGTEFGLYVSTNGGGEWKKFMSNLPTSRVDDILIHPRENDLIIATHSRGVFIADDLTPLQQMTPAIASQDAVLFDIRPAVAYLNDRRLAQQLGGQKVYLGENPPRGAAINYYLKSAPSGDVKISIKDIAGREIRTLEGTKTAGINRVQWNLAPTPPPNAGRGGGGGGGGGGGPQPVEPGTYMVTLTIGSVTLTKPIVVLRDEWMLER
jgi:photosystem II stability/assembly factor-like uncharacterized protein